jgi:hypothetical protein
MPTHSKKSNKCSTRCRAPVQRASAAAFATCRCRSSFLSFRLPPTSTCPDTTAALSPTAETARASPRASFAVASGVAGVPC